MTGTRSQARKIGLMQNFIVSCPGASKWGGLFFLEYVVVQDHASESESEEGMDPMVGCII